MKPYTLLIGLFCYTAINAQHAFDIEGHRGCRGLYPENTIPAFIEALKLGVNTLEMDVVVSADSQLVVSHDPNIGCDICDYCKDDAGKEKRIYHLPYSTIRTIDCGSVVNSKFPGQQKLFAFKPLLSEVIDTVEKYIVANGLAPVHYNIETKSTPDGDNVLHPAPEPFARQLYDMVKSKGVLKRTIIQSFDPRTLQVIHKVDSTATLALLVFNADGMKKNLNRLGFKPAIYSPNFILVNKKLIAACHMQHIKVIPWTVNDADKLKKLQQAGVDGVISDYPNLAIEVCRSLLIR
ncbi:MAG: glycerophosphodiester phosphodiesterase family protein [Chitinophagales bacterium]